MTHLICPTLLTTPELLRFCHTMLAAADNLPVEWVLELIKRLEQNND